jgi:hypothetical protein
VNKAIKRVLVATPFVLGVLTAAQGVAAADPATGPNGEFLCPAVGNATAADANGKGWGALPNGNFTFLPGNNQAGANANSKALNTENPPDSPGPGGGNSDWSPIWPGDNPDPG